MLEGIIKLIFPPKCIFCGQILDIRTDIDICELCIGKLPVFDDNSYIRNKYIFNDLDCNEVACLFIYTGIVKDSLKAYKFHNKPRFYRTYAKLMAEKLKQMSIIESFDMTIGVPLFRGKEKLRGYNQACLISGALAKLLNISDGSRHLTKIKDTGSQSLLPRDKRLKNLIGAYEVVEPSQVQGKRILLVDDIITTGSTIRECSKVLKAAGVSSVSVAVVATGRCIG